MRRLTAIALALGLALACAAAAGAQVRLHGVGSFDSPVHVAGAPGDGERLYVVEQPGVIRVVRDGSSQVFADLTGPVEDTGGEEGLLSVAFPPDFQTSRLLYVFFTNAGHDLEIAELHAPTGDAADPTSLRRVLEIPHDEANNHNGGQLQFGRDGYLYIATGDGGNSYDSPTDDAALTSSLLGKILRIDPHGATHGEHAVPPENPFGNAVWSYGLRNPWRFSFDRSTGDLIVGDVGQGTVEEVNFVPAADGAGRGSFFGWDECEGNFDANPPPTGGAACTLVGDVRPAISLLQTDGYCSVIGGYTVRDLSVPSLFGRYVYGDLCRAPLRSARLSSFGVVDDGEIGAGVEVSSLTSFGEDAGGCVYVTSGGGGVHRIVENDTRVPCEPAAPPPPDAGGNGDGSGDPETDTAAPRLRTRVKGRQRVLRLGGAVAYVRCSEGCSVAAGGRLRIGRRAYRMRRVAQAAQAGRRTRLKVRLTKRGRRALRRAVRRERPASVRLRLRARDAAGNRSPLVRRTVRVRR